MATLNSLPPEILSMICDLLDQEELVSLALTSKTLNDNATPFLYHGPEFDEVFEPEEFKKFLCFTMSILRNDELAAHVRSFSVRCHEGEVDMVGIQKKIDVVLRAVDEVLDDVKDDVDADCGNQLIWLEKDLTPLEDQMEPLQSIRRQIQFECDKLSPDEMSTIRQRAKLPQDETGETPLLDSLDHLDKIIDALLSLLFSRCTGLQTLDLGYTPTRLSPSKKILLRGKNNFPALERLMVIGDTRDADYGIPRKNFIAAFKIPDLKQLFSYNIGTTGVVISGPDVESLLPKSSNIELLEMRHSNFSTRDLTRLLEVPKNLQALIFEIKANKSWSIESTIDVRNALKPLEAGLDVLSLSHEESIPRKVPVTGPAVSFREFKKLRQLELAPVFAFGNELTSIQPDPVNEEEQAKKDRKLAAARDAIVKIVPRTLEVLRIRRSELLPVEYLLPAIEELVKQKEECAPNLSQIVVEGQILNHAQLQTLRKWPAGFDEQHARLKSLAREKGVQITSLNEGPTSGCSSLVLRTSAMFVERGWGINEEEDFANIGGNMIGSKECHDDLGAYTEAALDIRQNDHGYDQEERSEQEGEQDEDNQEGMEEQDEDSEEEGSDEEYSEGYDSQEDDYGQQMAFLERMRARRME